MARVLHVIGGLGRGGAPIFITNNLKYNDNEKVIYDFLSRKDNCAYTELIEKSGGAVYIVPEFPRHFIMNYWRTRKFFKNHAHEYSAIHVHANALIYLLPLKLAKKYNIPVRIIHSHNTQAFKKIYKYIHIFNMKRIDKYANVFLACGKLAGKWMYGNQDFEVINNAVDTDEFVYSSELRNQVRAEYGIFENTVVIGHVGRFELAKNHDFLIDIFAEYLKINSDTRLLLVGTGSLESSIINKIKKMKLEDKVIHICSCDDMKRMYQIMDVFVLPSLFEGFPFVLVEAQTNGIHCIVSDCVSQECAVTDLVHRISLNKSKEIWAKEISCYDKRPKNSKVYKEIMHNAGYDVKETSKRLAEIYCSKGV